MAIVNPGNNQLTSGTSIYPLSNNPTHKLWVDANGNIVPVPATPEVKISMLAAGDIIVRKAANGWVILRFEGSGSEPKMWVVAEGESIDDVIKLITVTAAVTK
jgi:hypothetical protein